MLHYRYIQGHYSIGYFLLNLFPKIPSINFTLLQTELIFPLSYYNSRSFPLNLWQFWAYQHIFKVRIFVVVVPVYLILQLTTLDFIQWPKIHRRFSIQLGYLITHFWHTIIYEQVKQLQSYRDPSEAAELASFHYENSYHLLIYLNIYTVFLLFNGPSCSLTSC